MKGIHFTFRVEHGCRPTQQFIDLILQLIRSVAVERLDGSIRFQGEKYGRVFIVQDPVTLLARSQRLIRSNNLRCPLLNPSLQILIKFA